MRIYEHEVKSLLAAKGIPIPRSGLARSPEQAEEIALKLGGPVALKAQTLVKARGKAGLIRFADTPEQAAAEARELLGREHQGEKVATLLVEEKVALDRELYLGAAVDYTSSRPVILACGLGGVDIEEVAAQDPDQVLRLKVTPSVGLSQDQALEVGGFLARTCRNPNPTKELAKELGRITLALYGLFVERDLEMVEINPLAVTKDGRVVALDGAAVMDGDALFRQQDLVLPRGQSQEEFDQEREYAARGWSYHRLDGDIGILSSGAGITMAILDLMRMRGGRPANFLDTAQMDRQGIYDAFHIFKDDPALKTVMVNIFAGLNRCDHLAQGIKDFLTEHKPSFKVVVRMIGNLEEEGRKVLQEIGIEPIRDLEQAVEKTIAVTESGQ